MTEQADIVVVGGGMIGLCSAVAARRLGFSVALFDQKPAPVAPSDQSANVIAMNSASTAFLTDIGVFSELPDVYRPAYTHMQIYDGVGSGSVTFDASDAGYPQLGHIVDQRALVAVLAERASAEGVQLNWSSSYDMTAPRPSLLVAADGAHSTTREQLGFQKLSYHYDQQATVCIATLSEPHGQCAWQWFHEDGPIALLPLAGECEVAVVWSSTQPRTDLDDDAFKRTLEEATEGRFGDIASIGKRFGFPLMQLHAFRYVAPGVALVGDAAHAIHPLAGQGANLGFADISALITELGSARIEGRSPGDIALLRRYEKARRSHNHLAGAAMEGFNRLFSTSNPLISFARRMGMSVVQQNALVRKMAVSVASGRV